MPTTTTRDPAVVSKAAPSLLYPTLLIAGIAVTIASVLGIAAMTGLLSKAQSQSTGVSSAAEPAKKTERVALAKAVNRAAAVKPAQSAATLSCVDCGVVESIRAVELKGPASGVGAVAGGVVGGILGNQVAGGRGRTAMTVVGAGAGAYAGHELEKNMNKRVNYEVRVRMDDKSMRTFHTAQPAVSVGQRVKIKDGRPVVLG